MKYKFVESHLLIFGWVKKLLLDIILFDFWEALPYISQCESFYESKQATDRAIYT